MLGPLRLTSMIMRTVLGDEVLNDGFAVQVLRIDSLNFPGLMESTDLGENVYRQNLIRQSDAFCNSLATLSKLHKLKIRKIKLRDTESSDNNLRLIGPIVMSSITVMTQLS